MVKVCSLDEAFNLLGICKEDRLHDFQGSYRTLEVWLAENQYAVKGKFIYKKLDTLSEPCTMDTSTKQTQEARK